MATHRPPNVFAPTPPGSQNGRRASRFTEHPMQEYTPANSVYDEDLEYGPDEELHGSRVLRRLFNGSVHAALCVILLAIMGQFMHFSAGSSSRLVT